MEDNPADVWLTRAALREIGSEIRLESVSSGAEALANLRRAVDDGALLPSLILLDLNLPGINGREVLAQIKEDPALRSIPVIVLSSSESEADVRQAYDLAANSYVRKPVDMRGLVQVMNAIHGFWVDIAKLPPT